MTEATKEIQVQTSKLGEHNLGAKKFVVTVMGQHDGEQYEIPLSIKWSLDRDFVTTESIGSTAAAMASVSAAAKSKLDGKRQSFAPVSVTRVVL